MVNICLNATKKVLGERPRSTNCRYKKRRLQKKMRGQIDSTRDEEIKARKRKERNKILNEIKEPNKEEKRKGHKERIRRNRIQTH